MNYNRFQCFIWSFHLEIQLFLFFFSFQDEKCSLLNRLKIRVALILWKEALIFRVSYSLKYSFFSLSFDDREEPRVALKILFALHALYEKSRKTKFGVYFWVAFVLKIISGSEEDNDFYFSYKRLFSRYSMTNWWITYQFGNKYEIWDPFSSGVFGATLNDLDIRIFTFMFIGEARAEICVKTLLLCLIRWVICSVCSPLSPPSLIKNESKMKLTVKNTLPWNAVAQVY